MRVSIRYKLLVASFYVLIAMGGLFLFPKSTLAASFNPGNIISDGNFTAKNSMSEQQIRDFLNSKGGYLATYRVPAAYSDPYGFYNGVYIGPFDHEVNSTGWDAAQVIYNSAQWYGINPQVILATLEKEQSLVTIESGDVSANEMARRIRWSMGFAVTDSGVIPACSTYTTSHPRVTNDNPTGSCAGLAMQIDWATATFAVRYATPNSHFPVGGVVSIGNTYPSSSWTTVTIANRATSSLYSYTPYTNGARSFYIIYNNWFDPTSFIYNSIKVTANVSISDYSPAIGENITTYFTLTNSSDVEINIPYIAMANWYNYPQQNCRDFGAVSTMTTFAPGETKEFKTFHRVLTEIGSYRTWVTFYYDGMWYNPVAQNGQVTEVFYSAHMPNIGITTVPIQLNPASPVVGQSVTASTVVRNYEPNPIQLDYLGIANWYDYPRTSSADYGFDANVTLAAYGDAAGNDSHNLSKTTILNMPSDNYRRWVAICIGGRWYEAPGSVRWYGVGQLDPERTFTVSQPLVMSDSKPAIGENVTVTFSVTNNSSLAVVIPYLAAANWYDYPQQNNRDFGATAYLFAPGETKQFVFHRTLTEIGSYRTWVTYYYGNSWHSPTSSAGPTSIAYSAHMPNIGITTVPIQLNPASPVVGQSVTASTVVRNYEPNPIQLDYLGIANWYDYPRTSSADYGFDANVTLAAYGDAAGNDSHNLSKTTILNMPSDNYRRWVAICIGGRWYEAPGSVRWYGVK